MADIKVTDDFKKLAETIDMHKFTFSDRYITAEMVPDMLAGLLQPNNEVFRSVAAEQLRVELTRRVANGTIQLHDPYSKLPLQNANLGAEMTHTDIEKFAGVCGLTLEWKAKGKAVPMEWDMQDFTEELAMEWLKKPCWSLAEAIFLLGEVQIPVSKLAGYSLPPEFAGNAGSGLDSLTRAIVTRQLKPVANMEGSIRGRFPVYAPTDVISVAESVDFGNWQNWKKRLVATTDAQPEAKEKALKDGINPEWQSANLAGAANIANRLVESVIVEMENQSKKITVATIWVELIELTGKSIIEDTQPDALLCNVGTPDYHRLTKCAVKGVLQRRRERQKNA